MTSNNDTLENIALVFDGSLPVDRQAARDVKVIQILVEAGYLYIDKNGVPHSVALATPEYRDNG